MTNKLNPSVLAKMETYPFTEQEIINAVLKSAEEITSAFNPENNPYSWTHPKNESTEWGLLYEREIRRRLNRLGKVKFEEGNHNTDEDLYCPTFPEFSTEIKTTQSNQFWNSPRREGKSTKYVDYDKKTFYICIRHNVTTYGAEKEGAKTEVKEIWLGMLSKNDWGNGIRATYLRAPIRDEKLKRIY